MKPVVDLRGYSLVFGPLELKEPAYSDALDQVEIYTPAEVADAILSYPGTRCIHAANPDWSCWQARWAFEQRYIEVDISECAIDPGFRPGVRSAWGGSGLRGQCLPDDLLALWEAIRVRCPGVWLQDERDCRLYTPWTFAAKHPES